MLPPRPQRTPGIGLGGEAGTEGTTFARPDSRGIRPYQAAGGPQRFGPGVPFGGGGASGAGSSGMGMGGGEEGMGLSPEEAAELMQGLAIGLSRGSGGMA